MTLALSGLALAQTTTNQESDRRKAFQLYDDWKLIEALPLLEKVAEQTPNDIAVLERLAGAIIARSATLNNREEAKGQRVRARRLLARAKELGSTSNYVSVILVSMPEDGGELQFSMNKEVDEAMREGEAAFASDQLDKAIAAYQRALLLNPKLYEAALFHRRCAFQKEGHRASIKLVWPGG